MPLGLTSCSGQVYEAFVSEDVSKTFYHGHSYTANPLACSAALASLDVFEEKQTFENISRIENSHLEFVAKMKGHAKLIDVRSKGIILALELRVEKEGYHSNVRDKAYDFFIEKGILLRPLGNIIYMMPPYCIRQNELSYIYDSILEFIQQHEF